MELGIPRSEMGDMTDEQVIRKWAVGLELSNRRQEAMRKAAEVK